MTCIIGYAHDAHVYIGADSMASNGYESRVTALRKVFRVGPFLIGYTTSFRMGQILQYHLEVRAQQDGESDERYMVVAFAESVRECLKVRGYSRVDSNNETGGRFVVGYKDRVYEVASDYQVNHYNDGLVAVGAGADFALGAMYALDLSPKKRILKALAISADLSPSVQGPFYVEKL